MEFLHVVFDALRYAGGALLWVLTTEEQLALLMVKYQVPFWTQIAILTGINAVLIAVEFSIVHLIWLSSGRVRKIQTPAWLKKISRGKQITLIDLFLFAFVPAGTQKIGVIAYHAKRKEFGFRGYTALTLGGMMRVASYPVFGTWLWALVVTMLMLRAWRWWDGNHRESSL